MNEESNLTGTFSISPDLLNQKENINGIGDRDFELAIKKVQLESDAIWYGFVSTNISTMVWPLLICFLILIFKKPITKILLNPINLETSNFKALLNAGDAFDKMTASTEERNAKSIDSQNEMDSNNSKGLAPIHQQNVFKDIKENLSNARKEMVDNPYSSIVHAWNALTLTFTKYQEKYGVDLSNDSDDTREDLVRKSLDPREFGYIYRQLRFVRENATKEIGSFDASMFYNQVQQLIGLFPNYL